jgi:hypothetical protein
MECWHVPQAPFQILYSRLVLEQIRLAVVDAYFVVPHGGVEIGGVLLGRYTDSHRRLFVTSNPFPIKHTSEMKSEFLRSGTMTLRRTNHRRQIFR